MKPAGRKHRWAALAVALASWATGCAPAEDAALRDRVDRARLGKLAPAGAAAGFNLLLITVDTLRADRLGCYGYPQAETPVIDRLSRPGILFDSATAAAPITLPSHATIMTGLHVPTHGVRNNGTFRLADEHRTLAEELRDRGYQTAAFVGAYVLDGHFGLDQGFEVYDDEVNPAQDAARQTEFSERPADRVSDAALAWLAGASVKPEPFFAWLHYFDPHAPYWPPEAFARRFPDRLYDGEISFTDEQLGRIIGFLEKHALRERTLVVLTADHGESLGEHGEETHALLIYDATVRVPLILSCPALFASDFAYGAGAVGLVDLFPTLLHLLAIDAETGVDGRDLFADPPGAERALYVESLAPLLHHGWAPLHALRRSGAKLIRAPEMEFFDLASDPGELENRYPEGGTDAARLERELSDLLQRWGSPLESLDTMSPLDAEERARLEALGYVGAGRRPATVSLADPKQMMPVLNRINQADRLLSQQRLDEAVAAIEPVLEGGAGGAAAWYAAARIYRAQGRIDRAREAIGRAVELDPDSEGFVTQAQLALMEQDEDGFHAALERALALDPDNGRIYLARGDRLAIRKEYREAIVEFERALAVDPYRTGAIAREKIALLRKRLGE
jgi:arylsulfatase A-like enzyme/Flp pilus assembly protein TadD